MVKNLLCLLLFAPFLSALGQTTQDTMNYPIFSRMMEDRSINFYATQRAAELYFSNRTRQKGDGWKPYKRWEWNAQNEIDNKGNFPNAQMLDMHRDMLIQQSKDAEPVPPGMSLTALCSNKGQWKPMGPDNLPTNNTGQLNGMGRLNAVALHPTDTNIIFVGAAAGGIWKTVDGGNTWNVFSDSLPTLGVSAIAINPNNPDTMYFGSGDRDAGDALGFGVFKSTNGGTSWTINNTGMGNREVGRLIIDPNNTSILLAACDNGIYRSTNSGATWTLTFTGGFMKEIIFMPTNSNVVYASRNGLFYRSINNGVTFTQITAGLPTSVISRGVIDVNPLDKKLVYFWAANGSVNQGFYLSRDSGTTFVTQSTTPNIHDYSTLGTGTGGQAWYNKDMVSDPTDAGIIYAAGVNIFKSTDTGRTWTISAYWVNQVHADNHELIRCPITNRIFSANDGGLYYTRNKGVPWVDISNGLGIAQIYKMGASRTVKDVLITGFQDNGTGNYNQGWFTTRGGDGMDCEVDQTDERYTYGELYYGSVFRVFNVNSQGTIAANGVNGITESGGWVTPLTLKEGSGNTMYIGYKNIWRSDNIRNAPANTVTWTQITNSLGGTNSSNWTALESSIADPEVLYASRSNNTFYRSDNVNAAAPTFTAIVQPIAGTVMAIETDPKISGAVYISIGNRVYRSLNKGGTWAQINTNLSSNVQCILLDTSSDKKGIYVGTQRHGCWYTDTTLSVWKYFSDGLPATLNVTDLALYYESKPGCKLNKLYGSSYNRGVWHTSTYNDGTQKPIAGVEQYDTVICASASLSLKDESCNNPTLFEWRFSPNTVSYQNGTDSCAEDITVTFASKGTYTFIHYAKNCNGYDSTAGIVIVGDTVKSACATTTTNNFTSLGLFNVKFAQINRNSAGTGTEGAYVNMACTEVATVKASQVYPVFATTGTFNDEQVKMFIDYNDDGDFTDVGELVWSPAAARTNHSGNITIPNTAIKGKIIRMRFRSDFISIGTNPCSNLVYGQTEDYGLYIEPDTINPKFVVNDSIICFGASVVFTDSTFGAGTYPYAWNFGMDASPPSSTAIGPHHITYTTPGYKSVSLTINGYTYTKDSAVLVEISPNITLSLVGNDSSICKGEAISIGALDNNASSALLQWYFNGTAVADSTFASYQLAASVLADSGNYAIIATIGNCIDTSATQVISVHDNPTTNFTASADSACFNFHQFTLVNNSTVGNGSPFSQLWAFGDGNTSQTKDTNISYNAYGDYSIKLKTTTIFGCQDSTEKMLRVNPSPTALFLLTDTAQCLKGNSFTFISGSSVPVGTLTHLWDFGDGNTAAGTIPSHTYSTSSDSFAMFLYITTLKGCKDTASQHIRVIADPLAAFNVNDPSQCFTNHLFSFTNTSTIAGSNSLSYQWTFGDGGTAQSADTNYTYTSRNNYTIQLIASTIEGCRDTANQNVLLFENAATDFSLNSDSQCFAIHTFAISNNSTLTSGTFTSAWNYGDGNTETITAPANKNYNSYDSAYLITLINTTNNGCKDTFERLAWLMPDPTANFSINDSTQCLTGNSFDFTDASSIVKGTMARDWDFGDANTSASISPNHSYAVASEPVAVRLTVTSDFGCISDTVNNVYIYPQPAVSFSVNDSIPCFNGHQFNFTNNTSISNGTFISLWLFGDGNNTNTTNPNYQYLAAGNYTVKLGINSNQNCMDSFIKPVEVKPNTNTQFSINTPMQCFNANAFNFTNASNISNGSFTSNWDLGDGNSSVNNTVLGKNYSTFNDSFVVKLTNTSNKGCLDSLTKKVYLFRNPQVSFSVNDTNQCLEGNVFNFNNNSIFTTSASTYNWSFADGNSSSLENPSHNYTAVYQPSMVKLLVTNLMACKDSAILAISTSPSPVANFSINDSFQCLFANSFRFTDLSSISSGNYAINYAFGDGTNSTNTNPAKNYSANGNYSVLLDVTSDSGCQANKTIALVVYPEPAVNFSVNDSAQCQIGNNFRFTDLTVGAGNARIWRLNNALLPGTNVLNTNSFANSGNHSIQLIITNSNGCKDSLSKTVTVDAHPSFTIAGSNKLCLNQSLDLTATSADPNLIYTWSANGAAAITANPYTVQGNTAGKRTYRVTAINTAGCNADSTLTNRVIVYRLPKPIIDTTVITANPGIEISFIDATNIPVLDRQWSFNPSASGTDAVERFQLQDTSTYSATLTLTDTNGCIGQTTETYFFIIPNGFYVPSAFTPNGDGKNETFIIPGYVNVKSYQMRIYNRWGETMFESKDPKQGWNGTYGNKPVMNGNYVYFIEIIDYTGKKVIRKGSVMVMR